MSRAVIDQPGFRLFTLGFLLSLILGLAGRAQISSVRLEKSLQKSIRLLEKDFSVDFELAEVRLAKWGLPLPHLIVYKLRISPKKNFCHNSQIFIDELEVPLSFKSIFFPEEAIGFVRAKNVDIRLVDLDECLTPDSNQRKADAALPSSVVTSPGTSGNLFTNSTRSHLKEISIEQLKIISLKNFDQPLVFKQMRFFLDYKESRLSQVEIKSKIYSIKDSRADIFFLIADFNATLKPDPTQNIDLAIQLKGRLLDGDIQAFMQASSLSRKLSFEMTTHKVSIKAFAPFFNRFKNDFNLDKWPLNIGFYMVGDAEEQGLEKKAFFKIKNFEAMGENMSLRSPEIDIEFLNSRTDLKPFTMSLYRIPLTPLKSIFADHFNFQSIESLGFLKGDFKFDDAKYWNFEGLLEKPELIFSNRGSRELQTVDSVQVNLNHKNELFNFKLDNVRLNQSEMLGEIEGFYANENKSLQIKLNLEGPILNERVWKQLTQVSQSPVLKMNWTYKKVQDERHQLRLTLPQLNFQGLLLTDIQIDFLQLADDQSKSLALALKAARAEVQVDLLQTNMIRTFFTDATELNQPRYSLQRAQISLQGPDWKSMNFDADAALLDSDTNKPFEHIRAKGDWKSDNTLEGTISMQNSRRILKYNVIKNVREEIEFIPQKKEEQ